MNHVLQNRFRDELGIRPGPTWDAPWRVKESAANPRATLEVDGERIPAVEIDTDPFVYGIGVQLRSDVVATVAIPRAELGHVRLALAPRLESSGQPL